MSYNRYRDYNNNNAVTDYKAKCALAEKLGDVMLRQWCVETIGHSGYGMSLDFDRIASLFEYIKEGKVG